ncbi:hypothetical protein [Nocardia sp. alder85J]|uniref:DoxX family protein n=1 Tax=Nocardia sp. alder85J TaxID=2862949 RepID=UPI001CD2848D|nr:hypothetical protein [Nocardia sp. alder85J]MCX4092290.1 hypothetical protein [Nocardia sp. alder85J]
MADRRVRFLTSLLFGTGVLHFAAPKPFDSIVPPQLPGSARTYTYASGVAELTVAAALAVPRTRRLGASLAVLLFLGVFPANIQFTLDSLRNPKTSKLVRIVSILRLPMQIPLVRAALRVRATA